MTTITNPLKPFFTEDAVCAAECCRAYVQALGQYMDNPKPLNDEQQQERNRVLRTYAKAAIAAIIEHMP